MHAVPGSSVAPEGPRPDAKQFDKDMNMNCCWVTQFPKEWGLGRRSVQGGYGTAVGGDYLMGPSNRLEASGETEGFSIFFFPREGQTEGSSVL